MLKELRVYLNSLLKPGDHVPSFSRKSLTLPCGSHKKRESSDLYKGLGGGLFKPCARGNIAASEALLMRDDC